MNARFPLVILDGQCLPADQARIELNSRLCMYGEGCFETLRSSKGGILKPESHLARLNAGARFLDLRLPSELQDLEKFSRMMALLLSEGKGRQREVRLRIQIWADDTTPGYRMQNRRARYLVAASFLDPQEISRPVVLATSEIPRINSRALPGKVKWTQGINYILAAREARTRQADDALMLTGNGRVSESTVANIFWNQSGKICTPDERCDLLPGITRSFLLEVLKDSGIPVQTGFFSRADLNGNQGVGLCNSVRDLYKVSELDGVACSWDESFWKEINRIFQREKKNTMHYVF